MFYRKSSLKSGPAVAVSLTDPDLCRPFSLQGYMMKKGHKRKNWTERWFVLKPNVISYYVGEDLAEQKGDVLLDGNCIVEARNSSVDLISETCWKSSETADVDLEMTFFSYTR